MDKFVAFESIAAQLPFANIDTDQIIPARFLAKPREAGLAPYLFYDRRRNGERFVLDDPQYRDARILVAGPNFGCGSSREHAVCALLHSGIRVVVAASISAIFVNNALENGLLPIVLGDAPGRTLLEWLGVSPNTLLCVDLARQIVRLAAPPDCPDAAPPASHMLSAPLHFDIDARYKRCLLDGVDPIAATRQQMPDIEAFEARHPASLSPPRRIE